MSNRRAVKLVRPSQWYQRGKVPLVFNVSMTGDKEYLDAALDGLLTAISKLKVGGWYAGWEAAECVCTEEGAERREPSSVPVSSPFEGKR
jgi:hypothetical protein